METNNNERVVKPIRYFNDENVRPKNAFAIGMLDKKIFVALLYREEIDGKEIYTKKVHTLKTDKQERIDIEEQEVEEVFNRILFY